MATDRMWSIKNGLTAVASSPVAQSWHRRCRSDAEYLLARVERLERALERFVKDELPECAIVERSRYCGAHGSPHPCIVAEARAVLRDEED